MSSIKRFMDGEEAKRQEAIRIAVEAKALSYCETHSEPYGGEPDQKVDAFKLGNYQWTQGMGPQNVFKDRQEMSKLIDEVITDHPADDCPNCEYELGRGRD